MHAPHYSDTCQCRNCRVVRKDMSDTIARSTKEYAARCDAKIADFRAKNRKRT